MPVSLYNKVMARRVKKKYILVIAIMTLVFTISILLVLNVLLTNILNKEEDEKLIIDYRYELKDDLLDLPLSAIDPSSISGDMFKTYEDDTYTSELGIDVSSHQKDIDWDKVKEAGIEFVYIRCGYRGYQTGLLNTDEMFYDHYNGAKEAGLKVGVYFFSHAINIDEAIEEA